MVFEDSTPSSGRSSRYLGAGFRHEPDFRDGTTTFDVVAGGSGGRADADEPTLASRFTPNLDFVFDDPAEGEPGRDRLLVHGIWEALLVLGVAAAGFLLYREEAAAFSADGLRELLLRASVLGLLAVASAVALRTAAPNLAVGALAVAAALYVGQNADSGLRGPLLIVLGISALVGLIQALVVVGLHVPSWAASLGVGLVLLIWSQRQVAVTVTGGYDPTPHALLWFGGFAGLSVVASLVALVPSLRRLLGRFRPVADPARRRGIIAATITLGAVVVSMALAGLAGALAVSVERSAEPSDGLLLTAFGLGAALLGGTSAFGRRGGIFGTVLAVALLTILGQYAQADGRSWSPAALAAGAIGLGLLVTRLVERFGRPPHRGDDEDEDWTAATASPTASWTGKPTSGGGGGGSSSGSGGSGSGSGGLWAPDEAWGSTPDR